MNVLVVEDNRDIAANIADYLEPRGHVLDFASSGPHGLELASKGRYDVIVLDIMLPGLDGISVCARLRNEARVGTPVLMLTARDQLDDKLEGFRVGADDYLVKPFSVRELEVRLEAIVKRSQNTGVSRRFEVADLQYDADSMTATRGGKTLMLNPIQRKLLEVLLTNTHRVVSREELETLIWGDELPDKDVLRTHIYHLRNVVDKPFDEKLVHTIHGSGYRLQAKQIGS